jgi:phosphoribosylformylglycinamidine synthase
MVPQVKLGADKKHAEAVKQLIHSNIINCAHDCSKGGLAVALGEMVIASTCGMNLTLDSAPRERHMQADELLFSESNSRYLLGTSKPTQVEEILAARKVPFAQLGYVSGDSMRINFENKILVDTPLSRLEKAYFSLENLVS